MLPDADRAACPDCLAEVDDGHARRFGYAFTTCARCGPRWSIATGAPLARERTTLGAFPMCPECAREWGDPADRRHRAPALCCPACGPHLAWQGTGGRVGPGESDERALARAAAALRTGEIVAVLGLGGFHLACDATDAAAIERLRARGHRPWKPLVVMVEHLDAARRVAHVDAAAAGLLASPAAPAVLLPPRADGGLAAGVAPGLLEVGIVLAATPLDRLLCRQAGRPLVMTSGRGAVAPLETSIGNARERLAGIPDGWLWHDRAVARPLDDTVVRLARDGPVLLRRARGHAPEPVRLAAPVPEPILAVGGHADTTVCIAVGDEAFVSEHLGDMRDPDTVARWHEAIVSLQQVLGVVPQVVAHDMHPGWLSSKVARERRARVHVPVQHHHAHAAAVVAEHGLAGPVLALAFDDAGWGPDGTTWGGELLLLDGASCTRLATVAPIALPGAERAVHEPWRLALSALGAAFGAEGARALRGVVARRAGAGAARRAGRDAARDRPRAPAGARRAPLGRRRRGARAGAPRRLGRRRVVGALGGRGARPRGRPVAARRAGRPA